MSDSSSNVTAPASGSSGTSLSDDVAITALIISLFALVVGLSQFLQAILGTAEGYRRCASSVIGPWSKLRNRKWRWAEFRFETKYIVPIIVLVDRWDEIRQGDCYTLDQFCQARRKRPWSVRRMLGRETVGQVLRESLHLDIFKRRDPEAMFSHPPKPTESEDISMEDRISYDGDGRERGLDLIVHAAEKGTLRLRKVQDTEAQQDQAPLQRSRPERDSHAARNALPVTWIALLHDLHLLYMGYQSLPCVYDTGKHPDWPKYDTKLRLTRNTEYWYNTKIRNTAHTRIAIIPMEETWDFMPPDVARPLAMSTVGQVVILTLRLGLQWRLLDRSRSQMNADGNGYSMSSTDVKGLGIVLKFSTFGETNCDTIVPSRAADKLMCGIIPGDPDVVMQDFDLVGHDRKLTDAWEPGALYSRLGLDERSTMMLQKQNRWTTHNEVVTLLCCFVALRSFETNQFYFSGWRRRQYSVFHFFEPRLALKIGLNNLLAKMKDNAKLDVQRLHSDSEVLATVRHNIDWLRADFAYEFYDTYTVLKPDAKDTQRRIKQLTERCKTIFDRTTVFFLKHRFDIKNGIDKTWYMQLVAAHARMSAWVNSQTDPSQPIRQEDILRNRKTLIDDNGIDTTYFAEHLYDQAERYVANVDHPEWGIVQYMLERSYPGSRQDIINAWWMLMLRGIVWDMSCKCLPYPGDPVPSSYYYDETSVWFT